MSRTKKYIAFDIGASSGRCIIGTFDGKKLSLEVLAQFDNSYVQLMDHYYWDILGLFDKVKKSLQKAGSIYGDALAGIGVDSFGLDFAFLDNRGNMIANPSCYRDPQTEGMMEQAFAKVPRQDIFETTGLQFMRINTLYQLMAMVASDFSALKIAKTFLMIPDLINYWLTGRAACEYTNTTNTQLLDVRKKQWAYSMINALGIPTHIFPEVVSPGQIFEMAQKSIIQEAALPPIPVVATSTADTACAVAAVPAQTDDYIYLSSGTWGLLGVESPDPILTDKVQKYNFGNEGGVFNTIRLLRNVVNLWLLQECRRLWNLQGQGMTWDDFTRLAQRAKPFAAYIDPDAQEFVIADNMPKRIQDYCQRSGQKVPQDKGDIIRVCLESLAFKYRYTIEKLTDIIGKTLPILHIVGGGARNKMLCQFAANACNLLIVAGPYEATSLGNILMQMIAIGDISSLEEGRSLIRSSFPIETFEPENQEIWERHYQEFLDVTKLPRIFSNSV